MEIIPGFGGFCLNFGGKFIRSFLINYYLTRMMKPNTNYTFTMVKPDAIQDGHLPGILQMIQDAGFRIVAMKYTRLSLDQAARFYDIHKERPFFASLIEFMSSGPIVAAILEKEDAVASFRSLIGATNPADAAEGTIRKKFARSLGENAIHGSDSDENADLESSFFFSQLERFTQS